MVVMLRELGVPARIVEGFTTGTYDSGLDRYVVKEIDAHAWVEVYFPQYGWIEFEPTPSQAPIFRVDSEAIGGASPAGGADTSACTTPLDRPAKDIPNENSPHEGQGGWASVPSPLTKFDSRP